MSLESLFMLAQETPKFYPSAEAHPEDASYWFPQDASTFGHNIDFLFYAIFWVSTVFFVLICAFMFYFVVKYRRQPGVSPQPSSSHNTTLEIFWSVIPSIILVWFFYEGARGWYEMKIPPGDAEEIRVQASQFNWLFTYPDGDQSNELHLVINRPVKLIMESRDVLHSLFIPAMRQKQDIVPGRYTYAYVMPNREGVWRLSCTEYCGDNHSDMVSWCHVHKDDATRKSSTKWIVTDHKPWENGERLYKIHCSGCHNINGVAATGPAFNDLWDRKEKIKGLGEVLVDENYVRESILEPNAKIVEGFDTPSKMQSFQGKLTNDDINFVISYLKHLKDPVKYGSDAAVETPAVTEPPAQTPTTDPAGTPAGQSGGGN